MPEAAKLLQRQRRGCGLSDEIFDGAVILPQLGDDRHRLPRREEDVLLDLEVAPKLRLVPINDAMRQRCDVRRR